MEKAVLKAFLLGFMIKKWYFHGFSVLFVGKFIASEKNVVPGS